MKRLTDIEIDGLQRFVTGADGPRPIHIVWIDRALSELKDRRAADLSAEELRLCDIGLGAWASDFNDAPQDEIATTRARIAAILNARGEK